MRDSGSQCVQLAITGQHRNTGLQTSHECDLLKTIFNRMAEGPDDQFIAMIDNLVFQAQTDAELADCLKWIDDQAFKAGIGFYVMTLLVLRKFMAEKRAKEWMQAR